MCDRDGRILCLSFGRFSLLQEPDFSSYGYPGLWEMLTNHICFVTPPVDLLNQFSPEDLAIYDNSRQVAGAEFYLQCAPHRQKSVWWQERFYW